MAFCYLCGAVLEEAPDCPVCGAHQEKPNILRMRARCGAFAPGTEENDAHARDIRENRIIAALSYLGPLCLVPYFAARRSPFSQYHAVRGLNLLLLEIAYTMLSALIDLACLRISWRLGVVFSVIFGLCALLFFLLSVIGLVNVSRGEMRNLPVVGHIRLIRR